MIPNTQIHDSSMLKLISQAGSTVTQHIKEACQDTGVDFAYMMTKAQAESSFQVDAKASTSSAEGLFQFIDSTWLSMIKQHGEKYGVDTKQSNAELLKLRDDLDIHCSMAAELAADNKRVLQSLLGNDVEIGSTELYMAHFMGAGKAASFLKTYNETPMATGADLFPKEARANQGVFYNSQMQPLSVAAIYDRFDQKFSKVNAAPTSADTQAPKLNSGSNTPAHDAQSLTPAARKSVAPQYSNADPFSYISKSNPLMDMLAPASPIIRKDSSAISSLSSFMKEELNASFGGNQLLQNPMDLLWLTALEDSLES